MSCETTDFGIHQKSAEKLIPVVRDIYRNNVLLAMMRYSRGSVLIQRAEVLTRQMIDSALT